MLQVYRRGVRTIVPTTSANAELANVTKLNASTWQWVEDEQQARSIVNAALEDAGVRSDRQRYTQHAHDCSEWHSECAK